ncbi:MAG: hypothetical protein PHV91_06890, partial [Bacteroidales bacterium]|nr:hypothetical protein [Bacteroidales bacterium]
MEKLLKNLKPYLKVFLNSYMPRWIIFAIDILVVIGAFATLWLIRDSISQTPSQDLPIKILLAIALYSTTSLTLKTYRGVVRFSSANDVNKIVQGAVLASAGYFIISIVCTISPSLNPYIKFHLWFPIVHGLMVVAGQLMFRFTVRSIFEKIEENEIIPKKSRAFFLGTDKDTVQIVNYMLSDKSSHIKPVAFIQT